MWGRTWQGLDSISGHCTTVYGMKAGSSVIFSSASYSYLHGPVPVHTKKQKPRNQMDRRRRKTRQREKEKEKELEASGDGDDEPDGQHACRAQSIRAGGEHAC